MEALKGEPSLSQPSVFQRGSLNVETINVGASDASSPPKPLLILTPTVQGTYPVLLFCHGFSIPNTSYTCLLTHISSHGFIVVAPQFYKCPFTSQSDELKAAGEVTDWISTSLQSVLLKRLQGKIRPDVKSLAVAGHSRGGKTAFALAQTQVYGHKFSALIGVDPVAGSGPYSQSSPKILTFVPRSFDINVPVAVIGAGLSHLPKGIIPPFAPDVVNHAEFFNESKPPRCYFLAKDYGHADMLNEEIAELASWVASSGKCSKDALRRGVGGTVVAFLLAYLKDQSKDLDAILDDPGLAPITLDPVIFEEK